MNKDDTFQKSAMKYHVRILFFLIFYPFLSFTQTKQTNQILKEFLPRQWSCDSMINQELPIADKWWSVLEDQTLDSLMREVVKSNYDVLTAINRIQAARANYRVAQGGFYPAVALDGGWTKQKNELDDSGVAEYFSTAASVSWEIDVFGSIRNKVKSQQDLYRVSKEDYNSVLVALTAQLAVAYSNLRIAQQAYVVSENNIRSQGEILRIAEVRFSTGLASMLDVAQAKSVYFSTKASLPAIQANINQYLNTIAMLMGGFPSELSHSLSSAKPLPAYYHIVGGGIPANLLRQRPDIRAAELTVSSQAALLGAAKSEWFPRFFVNGAIGYGAHRLDKLVKHDNLNYKIAPSVKWTIFQGMQRVQSQRLAKARLDESINQFNRVILTAVQEVETAMSTYSNSLKQVVALREVVIQGKETLKLSLELYKRGLSTFQSVLDAQRSLLSYENSLLSAQGNSLISLISLYQALGGGWNWGDRIEQLN